MLATVAPLSLIDSNVATALERRCPRRETLRFTGVSRFTGGSGTTVRGQPSSTSEMPRGAIDHRSNTASRRRARFRWSGRCPLEMPDEEARSSRPYTQ
ncbi:hypothetical protein GCM10027444_05090 [Actinopolyspora lacussalsi]